jgi:hypothetical protein
MNFFNGIGVAAVLAWIAAIIAIACGYIVNIITLVDLTWAGHEAEFVLRAVGIVMAPLGAIMGLFV